MLAYTYLEIGYTKTDYQKSSKNIELKLNTLHKNFINKNLQRNFHTRLGKVNIGIISVLEGVYVLFEFRLHVCKVRGEFLL